MSPYDVTFMQLMIIFIKFDWKIDRPCFLPTLAFSYVWNFAAVIPWLNRRMASSFILSLIYKWTCSRHQLRIVRGDYRGIIVSDVRNNFHWSPVFLLSGITFPPVFKSAGTWTNFPYFLSLTRILRRTFPNLYLFHWFILNCAITFLIVHDFWIISTEILFSNLWKVMARIKTCVMEWFNKDENFCQIIF